MESESTFRLILPARRMPKADIRQGIYLGFTQSVVFNPIYLTKLPRTPTFLTAGAAYVISCFYSVHRGK
jgi:hypothetical protein